MLDKTQSEIAEIDAAAEQAAAARADEMICGTETRSGKLLTVLDVGSQVEIEDAAAARFAALSLVFAFERKAPHTKFGG